MKVLILEDEERTAQYLEDLLQQYDSGIQVLARIPSVKKASEWLARHQPPDLILTDIHLEDALVFQLFDTTRVQQPIIFTTAFDAYVVKAFRVNSIDYLLKPVQLPELTAALEKYKALKNHFAQANYTRLAELLADNRTTAYKERFMITAGSKLFTISTRQAAYFILESKVAHLVTDQGQKLVVNYSLDELQELLDPSTFFRINRQCIVSHQGVGSAEVYSSGKVKVTLRPPATQETLVSGDRVAAFKTWLGK